MRFRALYLSVLAGVATLGLSSIAFAGFLDVTNASFEDPVLSGTDEAAPADWTCVGPVKAYNSLGKFGFAAADESNVILTSQSLDWGTPTDNKAVDQVTSNTLQANKTYTLGVSLGSRTGDNGVVTWGGSWLRIMAQDTSSADAYCLVNTYGQGTDPGHGNWSTVSTSVTIGDLSHVATISNGWNGTTPDGFADLSGGTYKLRILVGANAPGGANTGLAQTLLDNVNLTAVPEPGTVALLVTGLLAYAWRRRRR